MSEQVFHAPYDWSAIKQRILLHKDKLLFANLIALLATLASLPVPLLMPLMVDEVLLNQPAHFVTMMNALTPADWHGPFLYIFVIFLITVFLRLTSTGLGVWQDQQFTSIAKGITYKIRSDMLEHVKKVSMSEYEAMGTGAISSHFVTDVEEVDRFLGQSLSRFIVAILTIVGVAGILLWMHWQLALFILVMNPIVIYFTIMLGRKVTVLKQKENTAFELFQQALNETLDAIQQVRASNRERFFLGRVRATARAVRDYATAFKWKSEAANRLSFTIFLVGFDIFRAVAMLMVVFSDLSIGQMFAVFGYLWFMMTPVQEVLNIQYAYHSATGALSRLNTLFQLQQEPQYPKQLDPFENKTTVEVRLEDLCFRYKEGPWILNDISLTIHPGEKVALVGASGGGKTTLVQILLGLYPPHSGRVYFDNVPVNKIGMDVVRQHVATVLQHPALFNDSVRMNMTLGNAHTDEACWHALHVAALDDFVKNLPEQLNTIIGQHGVRLSGGQRQRLAIARMVLANPKVVILDEATSSLDTHTEEKVHFAMQRFLKGRTTLIIAHRLSAVKQADRAYVFDGGQIIEQGSHEKLIAAQGVYAKLYGVDKKPSSEAS